MATPVPQTHIRRLRAQRSLAAPSGAEPFPAIAPHAYYPRDNAQTPVPAQTLRIGLQANSIDPFWVEVRETIWHACQRADARTDGRTPLFADLSPALPITLVEVETLPEPLEGDDFAARLEAMMALQLDALIAVPASMRFIEALLTQGLPVVALHHRDLVHPRFCCLPELYPSARLVCEYLVQQLGGCGRVLIVGGQRDYGRAASSSRLLAALDVFGQAPQIAWQRVPAPWDHAGAVHALMEELENRPTQFDAIFGMSDSLALAGREVCERLDLLAPGGIVVGINGDPLAIAAIANGEMNATVATSAAEVAHESLRVARLAALGESMPPFLDFRPQLVTAENVAKAALKRLVDISALPSRLVGANRRQELQRLADMETSSAIIQRIGSLLDRDQLLHEIGDLILSRYGYDHVCVYLWEAETQSLVLQARAAEPDRRQCLPITHASIPGRAFLHNRPIHLSDVMASWRFAADPESPHLRSRTAVPIRLGKRTLGVLDLHSRQPIHHTTVELSVLQLLADQVGVGLENARLYAEAIAAGDRAERADSFKTRLLTNISHELRAPLNTILGYTQAGLHDPASYGVPLPPTLLADLGRVQRAGEQLVQLVDDLLSLSQAEIGALEIVAQEVDLAALLTEMVRQVSQGMASLHEGDSPAPAAAHTEGLVWRLVLPNSLPRIWGDPVRLRQLLLDLLSNARKFTERGYIEVGATVERDNLRVWVADTGIGIPAAQLAQLNRLFAGESATTDSNSGTDPDNTTEAGDGPGGNTEPEHLQPRSGLGLGLSVAYHIARLHSGSLMVESALGHGTICHVRLPLAGADATLAPALHTAAQPSDAPASSTKDGSAPQLDSMERILQGMLQQASDLTRQIADFLTANYQSNITREEIAAAMRVSPDYVSRVFRKETGITPWQYLARYRILQAQRMLLTTELSITEIANATGFNDAAYFVRVFHRETGKAPQRYRKNAKPHLR